MENFRAFRVTYLAPTNTLGARIKIQDLRSNKRLIISFNYRYNDIKGGAVAYLDSRLGIEIIATAEDKDGYILLSPNFYNQLI